MKKQPFEETFDKVAKELQDSISTAMSHLQKGMQEYLSNNIDISSLLKVVENVGINNILGMKVGSIPGFDAYKILGLEKTATNEEVKQRYRSLLSKIHPDVSGIKGTEFLTQMVVLAYQIIEKERKWE